MSLFWITMVDTLWQSLVLFYVPLFTYRESTIDIWSMGSLWTIAVVILVNVHLAMDIQRWVFVTHLAIWGSLVVTYGCMVVLDSIPVFPNYGLVYFNSLFIVLLYDATAALWFTLGNVCYFAVQFTSSCSHQFIGSPFC